MENPEIMAGIPMLALGALGLLMALLLIAAPPEGEAQRSRGKGRAAVMVFLGLGWLTAVEYVIAVETSYNMVALGVIAAVKAVLIMLFFMQMMRVRHAGEGH